MFNKWFQDEQVFIGIVFAMLSLNSVFSLGDLPVVVGIQVLKSSVWDQKGNFLAVSSDRQSIFVVRAYLYCLDTSVSSYEN